MSSVSCPSSALGPAAVAAYHAALYSFDTPELSRIELHIGEAAPVLAALYARHGVASCAFLTACNPLGEVMDSPINEAATAALGAELAALGLPVYPGEGSDPDPAADWREASFAVLGMCRDAARQFGIRWRQNAVVWVGTDTVPELVLLL